MLSLSSCLAPFRFCPIPIKDHFLTNTEEIRMPVEEAEVVGSPIPLCGDFPAALGEPYVRGRDLIRKLIQPVFRRWWNGS